MSVQMDTNVWKTPPVTAHHNLQNSYPVQLLIKGRRALVVGAGNVALRKIQGLLRAGAEVTVVAPWVHPLVSALPVEIIERPYLDGEAGAYQLVITCTDDWLVNRQVFRDAEAQGVWVNSADDPVNCSFILPAVARQGDLTLTISTNGQSPAMAMWLRRKFEAEFDERYDRLMELLVEVRAEARYVLGTSEVSGWNEALDDGVFELVAAGDIEAARHQLRTSLGLDAPTSVETEAAAQNALGGSDPRCTPPNSSATIEPKLTVFRANGSATTEPKVTVLRANESASIEPKETDTPPPHNETVLRANGRPSIEAEIAVTA